MTISNGTLQLLQVISLPKCGVSTVRKLAIESIESSESLNSVIDKFITQKTHLTTDDINAAKQEAIKIVEECNRLNIAIISIADGAYPSILKSIKDAPPFLYIRGNVDALTNKCVAIVGTRKASDYGKKIATKIAMTAVNNNLTVVSGLALGIDTAAHEGALEAHGCTIAIMAHGLDSIAPTSNKALAERIIDSGGALVSEHAPGVPARPPEFVRRNRIQCGISVSSIIVETGEVGGTVHQARFTKEQGRGLLVILPEPMPENTIFNDSGGKYIQKTLGGNPIRNMNELETYFKSVMGHSPSKEENKSNDDRTQLNFAW